MAVIDDLETRIRYHLRDTGTDPRWTSAELKIWLADGQDEICKRAYAIEDTTTAAVCMLSLSATVATYDLSRKIILIEEAALYDATGVFDSFINVVDRHEMTYQRPTWITDTGKPTDLLVYDNAKAVVTPIPTTSEAGYYIMMTVKRLPLHNLTDSYPTPEISSQFSDDMVNWACYKAYLKDDTDTQDLVQAGRFLGMFEASVGSRPNAAIERAIKSQSHDMHIQVRR
jgi:hypothetical protein